jgi:deoxyribonucleoside regulator
MNLQQARGDRINLLADVAEMYYLDGKTQSQIAKRVGVTRSMVSRMLTEARRQGIVEINIRRPLRLDRNLEEALNQCFGLKQTCVVVIRSNDGESRLHHLGAAAARLLKEYLKPNIVLGLSWGTAVSATVDALEIEAQTPVKIVQLVGALGSRNKAYDGHGLVARLEQKLGGEGFYLNAPYLMESAETARALLENKGVRETVELGKQSDLALMGIGSTDPRYSSFYIAGYLTLDELNQVRESGAVGDVCGLHFNPAGEPAALDFQDRLVTIDRRDLLNIPIRIGVAGGPGKVEAILGALRGGYVNHLVTDNQAARELIKGK